MELNTAQIEEVRNMIEHGIHYLYNSEIDLINREVNERSIVFRFGLFFSKLLENSSFAGYDLDCEYNRNGVDPKRGADNPNGMQPDLILHKRGHNENNAVVIEFKCHWNNRPREADRQKVTYFTNQAHEYRYGLGVFVDLESNEYLVEYYINGNRTA